MDSVAGAHRPLIQNRIAYKLWNSSHTHTRACSLRGMGTLRAAPLSLHAPPASADLAPSERQTGALRPRFSQAPLNQCFEVHSSTRLSGTPQQQPQKKHSHLTH